MLLILAVTVFIAIRKGTNHSEATPTSTPGATRTLTSTLVNTPTLTPTLPLTVTPTQTATPLPLPSAEDLNARFNNEINPLVKQLLAAKENPDVALTSEYQIIYVPQTERLYYVQSILQLTRTPDTGTEKKAYVLYDYSRGSTLGYRQYLSLDTTSETQEITATIRLIVEENGKFYLVEKEEATGGSGSTSFRNLVENAVLPLNKLSSSNPAVQTDLEEIIGYTCGIDMTPTLDYNRKVALLTSALSGADWAERRQGAFGLGGLNPLPLDTAPALIPLMGDTSEGVASAAEYALSRMAEYPQVFDLLLKAASDPNAEVRAHVVGLISTKPDAALATLLTLGCDEDAYVRQKAKDGLVNSGKASVIPSIITALKDEDPCIRQAAAGVLSEFGTQAISAVPNLTALLQDTSPDIRKAAALALCKIGSQEKSALPELIKAAQNEADQNDFSREISCIANLSSKTDTLPLLKGTFTLTEYDIRYETFNILGTYQGVPGAVELLILALSDKDEFVRWRAAETLVEFGSEAQLALPELIKAAQIETDGDAFESEISTITNLSSKADTLPLLKKALASPKYDIRRSACSILATYQGIPGAVEALIPALSDKDEYVPAIAAHALAEIGRESKSVLPELIKVARKETNDIAFEGEISAIASLSSKADTLPLLKEALTRSQVIIRYKACEILAAYQGVPGAEEALTFALKDSQASVRQAAAEALAKLSEAK